MTYPRFVIYYDNESNQNQVDEKTISHSLMLGCAVFIDYEGKYKTDEIRYTDESVFWDWVITKTKAHEKLYILAHNQDFDFRLLRGFTNLAERGFYLKRMIPEYGRFILSYTSEPPVDKTNKHESFMKQIHSRRYIEILDTLNWFKASLAQLGEIIGIPKTEMPSPTASIEQWFEYCMNDVIVLQKSFEYFIAFLKEHELGSFSPTIASQAMSAFRSRFMEHGIHCHHKREAIQLERQSYYGGRTECFYIGKKRKQNYYKLDINSMYPYVMREFKYPTRLIATGKIYRTDQWKRAYQQCGIIANVDVETEYNCIPYKIKDKLVFPIGSFNTTLCFPEIRLLDKLKIKYTVREINFYQTASIFKGYMNEMYALRNRFRSEGNEIYQQFTKILMNSLYGKFGQRNETWENIGNTEKIENWYREIYNVEENDTTKWKCVGGTLFESGEWKDGFDSFVAISAYVTSYSRVMLWNLMDTAGYSNVYYMDTDSLIVNQKGYDQLKLWIDPTELGWLKLEGKSKHLLINNLKDYEFGEEIKIKGVGSKAIQLDTHRYITDQWEHFNGALRAGRTEEPITRKVIKTMARKYEKGKVLQSGIVTPYRLEGGTMKDERLWNS